MTEDSLNYLPTNHLHNFFELTNKNVRVMGHNELAEVIFLWTLKKICQERMVKKKVSIQKIS